MCAVSVEDTPLLRFILYRVASDVEENDMLFVGDACAKMIIKECFRIGGLSGLFFVVGYCYTGGLAYRLWCWLYLFFKDV